MADSSLKFIVDECIPPVLATFMMKLRAGYLYSMRDEGHDYLGKPDEEWIPAATNRGFIIITCDRNMLKTKAIANALHKAQAIAIFLPSYFAQATPYDKTLWLLKVWPKIREYAATMKSGDTIKITQRGQITSAIK